LASRGHLEGATRSMLILRNAWYVLVSFRFVSSGSIVFEVSGFVCLLAVFSGTPCVSVDGLALSSHGRNHSSCYEIE